MNRRPLAISVQECVLTFKKRNNWQLEYEKAQIFYNNDTFFSPCLSLSDSRRVVSFPLSHSVIVGTNMAATAAAAAEPAAYGGVLENQGVARLSLLRAGEAFSDKN